MSKKKKILLGIVAVLVAVAVGFGVAFFVRKQSNKYVFEKRVGFSVPEYATDVTELKKEISDDSEVVNIKFKISQDKLSEFKSLLEKSEYLKWFEEFSEENLSSLPRPERTDDNWDLDYDRLSEAYYGHCTRKQVGLFSTKTYRGEIDVYLLEAQNGTVEVYLSYCG